MLQTPGKIKQCIDFQESCLLIDRTHRWWFVVTMLLAAGAVGLYCFLDSRTPNGGLRGGDTIGLWYGVLGTTLMVFVALLSGLRRVPGWWFIGSRRGWLRGHVWFGLLSGVFILCHSHFRMGGPLEFLLMLVMFTVIVSGILLLGFQQVIPGLIRDQVNAEAPLSQIPELLSKMRGKADALFAKALGEMVDDEARLRFQGGYLETIRPWLGETVSENHLLASAVCSREFFGQATRLQGGAALASFFETMETYCNERRQLVRQVRLHRLLHAWLLVHVPLSVMLLLLGVAHVISALYW